MSALDRSKAATTVPKIDLALVMERFYIAQLRARMEEVGFPAVIAVNASIYAKYTMRMATRVFPPLRKRLERYRYAVIQADADWQDYLAIQLGVLRG